MKTTFLSCAGAGLILAATLATAAEKPAQPEFQPLRTDAKRAALVKTAQAVTPAPVKHAMHATLDASGAVHVQCEEHENPEYHRFLERRRTEAQ